MVLCVIFSLNLSWNIPKILWSKLKELQLIRNVLSNSASWTSMPSRTHVIQWLLQASTQNLLILFCWQANAPAKASSSSSRLLFLMVYRVIRRSSCCWSSAKTPIRILEARITWKKAMTMILAQCSSILWIKWWCRENLQICKCQFCGLQTTS